MNKREISHLLKLAKDAILVLFDYDKNNFGVVSYKIAYGVAGNRCIWLIVEVANEFDGWDYYKIRVENEKVTYLLQVTENYAL